MNDITSKLIGELVDIIDLSVQKITEDEIDIIGQLLLIELCMAKSIHKYKDSMKVLDYYEVEDEKLRLKLDEGMQDIISNFEITPHFFSNYVNRSLFDYVIRTHFLGSETV